MKCRYNQYRSQVYSVLHKIRHLKPHHIEDIFQEAVLRALKKDVNDNDLFFYLIRESWSISNKIVNDENKDKNIEHNHNRRIDWSLTDESFPNSLNDNQKQLLKLKCNHLKASEIATKLKTTIDSVCVRTHWLVKKYLKWVKNRDKLNWENITKIRDVRMRQIAHLHFSGYSNQKIARLIGYSNKHVAISIYRIKKYLL